MLYLRLSEKCSARKCRTIKCCLKTTIWKFLQKSTLNLTNYRSIDKILF